MNCWLLAAAVVSALTGVVHSVLGERMIFTRARAANKRGAKQGIDQRYIGIIWATWHLASVLGFGLSAILVLLSIESPLFGDVRPYQIAIATAYLICSLLVLVGTKGKHPGWIALGVVTVLTLLA